MSSTLKTFEIKLDNPTATYGSGAIITGQVIIDLITAKSMRALKLRFKGSCEVYWEVRSGNGKTVQTTRFRGEEEYFHSNLCLFGSTGGDTIEMLAGHHVFPFNYALPRNIPNSYKHSIGSVEYSIKAIIDRPWKFDHETTKAFTVETPFELNPESRSLIGINDEVTEDYCCIIPCISRGSTLYNFRLPTTGYTRGDVIQLTVNITSQSDSVGVNKVIAKLLQRLDFHASSRTNSETNVIEQNSYSGPFAKQCSVKIGLRVPSIPSSKLQYCNLIDISYAIHIEIQVSRFHCNTQKYYDILIGTKPAVMMTTQQADNPVSHFETPPTAPIEYSPLADPTSAFLNPDISYPMPSPTVLENEETSALYPQFSTPYLIESGPSQYSRAAAPYLHQLGRGFTHQSPPIFQPPQNMEFTPSNHMSPFNYLPEQLPPSYDSVIASDHKQ